MIDKLKDIISPEQSNRDLSVRLISYENRPFDQAMNVLTRIKDNSKKVEVNIKLL